MKFLIFFKRPKETQPDAASHVPPVKDPGKLIRPVRR